jgi:ParB/RepB/Spo0J family partition protein
MSVELEKETDELQKPVNLPMSEILADEQFNCRGRIPPSEVLDLAEDIGRNKLMYPVIVRAWSNGKDFAPGKPYALVAGFRRFKAYEILDRDTIPCIVQHDMQEVDARITNLRENLLRRSLNIVQEAKAVRHLKDIYSHEQIGKMFGQSRGWAQVRCNLLELPADIQAEAAAGMITQSQIKDIYALPASERHEAVRKIKERKLAGDKKTITVRKANPYRPRIRQVTEIRELQDFLRVRTGGGKVSEMPMELQTVQQTLAWCAGEITDMQLHGFFREVVGDDYEIPNGPVSEVSGDNEG